MATVKLIDAEGEEHIACANGTGPVDSAYKAVDHIVKVPVTLLEYSMNAVTEGIDAIATTRVLIRGDNNHTSTNASEETVRHTFSGTGAGMDIVISSVRAYINALNKMLGFRNQPELKDINSPPDLPAKIPFKNSVEEGNSQNRAKNGDHDEEKPRNDLNNDEITILKSILDNSKNGVYPFHNFPALHDFLKNSLQIDVHPRDLNDEISKLREKYINI
ncbi:hypothetical protein TEA_012223 [Camellia sinensis var. sinensis]|uniref:2-isopropylmalate synthase LeuA allosteric (dimerisation) domain-containing protein n=1 Tax=Camellia sinensis var. sinensis TaxID=542762 RepID=A0A4S4E1L6_CAMSN|nr:hypothetical protein TEA_012223 [Camellia sinensis var. sinensis]